MDHKKQLIEKFEKKTAKIAILGMGYVGLPLAVVFAKAGFEVFGIDPNQDKIDSLNDGDSYIVDVPSEEIQGLLESGKFKATSDFSVIKDVDGVSICVPTPMKKTGDPDLSFIISATESLSNYLHSGIVIVLESSTYPGTTREMVLPIIQEHFPHEVGVDFFLAFSPERVDPGRKDWTTINTPKVIGGITEDCSEVASVWYCQALEKVVPVTSTEIAEMAKLLENTFRMINIGLVNELAIMCDRLGLDVWEVIDAAATKPFGFMKFTPGPGIGGHCIPIDPLYLSWKLKSLNYNARFIELASEINTNMPRFVVRKVQDALNDNGKPVKDSDILILGVAYKADIDDVRESPAIDVIQLLEHKGAKVSFHDPFVKQITHDSWSMDVIEDFDSAVVNADCIVIVTNHSNYDYQHILDKAKLIVDTRNALGKIGRKNPKVVKL